MYLLYKNPGETCLEALGTLKKQLASGSLSAMPAIQDDHRDVPGVSLAPIKPESLTYAGRLDPLARGLLVVLQGEEIRSKQSYIDLPKTYEFDVVFGVSTDTFDQLGVIYPSEVHNTWKTLNFDKDISTFGVDLNSALRAQDVNAINRLLNILIGKVTMHYPFFSSQPVKGIPLFQYSKDKGIAAVNLILPTKEVDLISLECLGISHIQVDEIKKESIVFTQKMKGDFRQEEIIASWDGFNPLTSNMTPVAQLSVLKLKAHVASGFYVRSLACWLGQITGSGALARDIYRTNIGGYSIEGKEILKLD